MTSEGSTERSSKPVPESRLSTDTRVPLLFCHHLALLPLIRPASVHPFVLHLPFLKRYSWMGRQGGSKSRSGAPGVNGHMVHGSPSLLPQEQPPTLALGWGQGSERSDSWGHDLGERRVWLQSDLKLALWRKISITAGDLWPAKPLLIRLLKHVFYWVYHYLNWLNSPWNGGF